MGISQGKVRFVKILIDTNVVLDVALERQPHLVLSEQVLLHVEQGTLEGYISASTFTDLYYLICRARGRDWALNFLTRLLTFCHIATVDQTIITNALAANFGDLEDGVQHETAIANQLAAIVTRNTQDFPSDVLQILTPAALLQQLSQSIDQSS